jgi:hypothetical protein
VLEGKNLCTDITGLSLIDIFEIQGVVYLDDSVIFWHFDAGNVWYLISENVLLVEYTVDQPSHLQIECFSALWCVQIWETVKIVSKYEL